MTDEFIAEMEPAYIQEYLAKFYQTIGAELRSNAHSIPCAFGIMLIEPMGPNMVRFNIITGSVKELLPKGAEEAQEMLHKMLRDWESENYPDKINICNTHGTA